MTTATAIASGDTISVHYTGKLENGEVFDSSVEREPLQFTVGSGQLIKGFDTAVTGMKKGEKTVATIPPEEAYGPRNDEYVIDMPKQGIPAEVELEIGQQVHLQDQNGNPVPARVQEILDDVVKMDINHPLAGQTLIFEIEVIETGLEPQKQHNHDDHDCSCGHDH